MIAAQVAAGFGQGAKGPIVALIPAYNEERFIGSLVLAVQAYVHEVIVVDDGSRDRTAEIARLAGATVVRNETNGGKASAVNTGFQVLRSLNPHAVVMLDGDGQHSPDDIPVILAPVLDDSADVVVGSRFREVKSDIPAYRQVGQHGLTVATFLTSGVWSSDSQSGFRAFSWRAVRELTFSQSGFSIESEMQFLVHDRGLRLTEVPIKVTYAEPPKRNPMGHGFQVLNGILRLVGQTRPLLFFSASGLATFSAGLLLGLRIIDIYIRSRELAVGYGLITVLLCVVGVLLVFAGLILHSTRGMFLELRASLLEQLAPARQISRAEGERQAEELALEVGR